MPVVTFAVEGRDNCVVLGDDSYVYARTEHGSFVLATKCPHRGGPLNLASFEEGGRGNRLVCPWHERATSVTKAIRAGIPAVRHGDRVTAVLPEPGQGSYELQHRPLSPALRADV
ncbi:Rieske 2Fe-2S domain-containing protein [Streptomyces sp. NPDC020807]|uniref:Rieske 2Fe-2S domain-containing protein n=1 Tax=Streptomyces sp. NPDC020807 TaxID=3155119 RepID=UPI0033C22FDB